MQHPRADIPFKRDRWLGVELRHLAALAAVADQRSFRAAGEQLGYAQSAISRQIAHLEELTGDRLIERQRGPKPVHLTDSGELLLEHAHEILAILDAAKRDLDGRRPASDDEVRVGLSAGVPTRVLAASLPAFAQRYPGAPVSISETASDGELLDLVRRGRVDLAIGHLPAEPGPYASCELLRVPWVLVVPSSAPLCARATMATLAQIARLPLIGLSSPGLEPWSAAGWDAACPRVVARCDSPHTAQALVGAEVGAALLPALAVDESDPRTTVIELRDRLPAAAVGILWLRHRTPSDAIVRFRELVRQVCWGIGRQPPRARRFQAASVTPLGEVGTG